MIKVYTLNQIHAQTKLSCMWESCEKVNVYIADISNCER